ncbi:MAG: hypothetical protein J6Y34_02365 [Bacteroidales bacterium]|nr:hypothetical protein [Bacteroidales bacterium]
MKNVAEKKYVPASPMERVPLRHAVFFFPRHAINGGGWALMKNWNNLIGKRD